MSRLPRFMALCLASVLPLSATAAKNIAPSVSLTAPSNGTSFSAPATITLSASASDPDGSIAKVDFYRGGNTLIASATTAPYTATWASVPAGSYTLTAKATDSRGATTTSAAIAITVTAVTNTPPSVALTTPAPGTRFVAPATIALAADAADPDDAVSKVEFLQGSTLLGATTAEPYVFTWANVPVGSYTLTARATDSRGATATSSPVIVAVGPANLPPLVAITSPSWCALFDTDSGVDLGAQAIDPDGSVVQVDFYAGSTLIGSVASAAPLRDTTDYPLHWAGMSPGTYTVTAYATDNLGASTASAPITLTVAAANQPPQVVLTTPSSGAAFGAGAPITLSADASDNDGSITQVAFYYIDSYGLWTWLGTSTTPPYSIVSSDIKSAGQYALTALATDNRGAQTQSANVPITVSADAPPTVSLTAPAAGSSYVAPATIQLSADATDSDGTISKVEFFQGTTLIGTATNAPYAYTWTGVPAGNYTVTAKATDNLGASTVSTPISITVTTNTPPAVTLTSPATGSNYFAPATIQLSADATDSDGSIAKVEFLQGNTLIGTATSAPYAYTWTGVVAGSYTLTAKATDNYGVATSSAPVSVTVNPTGLSINSPSTGTTLTTDSVLVSGTVQARPNSGLTVNGILAIMDDSGHFYANAVPLTPGENNLTATLTTPDNQQTSQNLTVNYAPQSNTVTISGSPLQGLAPLQSNFSVTPAAGANVSKIELDYNDDGSVDNTYTSTDSFTLTYATPGTYRLKVIATDSQGNVSSQVFVIQVLSIGQLDTLIQGVYTGMVGNLRTGDINGALSRVTGGVHDKYAAVFNTLGPSLSSIADNLGTIQGGQVSEDFAEYLVVRDTPNGPQGFLIYFLRGEDGVWRIDGM